MKVVLIQPPGIRVNNDPRRAGSPLGILLLAGNIRKYFANVDVEIIDAKAEGDETEIKLGVFRYGLTEYQLEDRLKKASPDIVGISNIFTSEWQNASMCARVAKRNGARVILGGHHPTYTAEFMLEKTPADILIYGEGDIAFHKILENFSGVYERDSLESIDGIVFRKNGSVIKTKPSLRVSDLDKLGDYSYDLLKAKLYSGDKSHSGPMPNGTIFADWLVSHGCPIKCEFCTSPNMHGTSIRTFSPERIREQAKSIKQAGFNRVNIEDDQFLMIPRKSLEAMIDELGKQGLEWEIDAGVYYPLVPKNKQIFEMAASNGLKRVYLPMEHPSAAIMHAEHKYLNLRTQRKVQKTFTEACTLLNNFGVDFYVAMMVGFPQETKETLELVRDYSRFAKDHGAQFVTFFYLKPFPGTPDFRHYNNVPSERRFEIAPEYWGLGTLVLRPNAMKIEQLKEKVEEISLEINGRANIIPGRTSAQYNAKGDN